MGNFYTHNANLKKRVESAPWATILPALEQNFSDPHELAPGNLEDAVEQIGLVLELVGELASEEIAPRAAEVDKIGARLVDGAVVYPEPMLHGFPCSARRGSWASRCRASTAA